MDFWASLEHKIHYKFNGDVPDRLIDELTEAADASDQLDRRMEQLHSEVHDRAPAVDTGEDFDDEAMRILRDLSRREGETVWAGRCDRTCARSPYRSSRAPSRPGARPARRRSGSRRRGRPEPHRPGVRR